MPSSLLRAVLAEDNFWTAWEHVRAKRSAAGLDGVSIERLEPDPGPALELLRRELRLGRYRPWPLRRVWLPKRSGGRRPVGVATVRDRIAQRAVLQQLAPRCEPTFNDCSFAYRPGLGVREAVQAIEGWRDEGFTSVLEADIRDCFDSLDRTVLTAALSDLVTEPDVLRLIHHWLQAGVVDRGTLLQPTRGVAQGDILSPLLCNLYLDALDDSLERFSGHLVRYADDFVVLTRTPRGAVRAQDRVASVLERLRLELNLRKTRVTSFEEGFQFLGVEFIRGLAVPQHQVVTYGPDGVLRVHGEPRYELEVPRLPTAPDGRVLKRLGHALDHAAARAERRGKRLTSMAEAFREALADEPEATLL